MKVSLDRLEGHCLVKTGQKSWLDLGFNLARKDEDGYRFISRSKFESCTGLLMHARRTVIARLLAYLCFRRRTYRTIMQYSIVPLYPVYGLVSRGLHETDHLIHSCLYLLMAWTFDSYANSLEGFQSGVHRAFLNSNHFPPIA